MKREIAFTFFMVAACLFLGAFAYKDNNARETVSVHVGKYDVVHLKSLGDIEFPNDLDQLMADPRVKEISWNEATTDPQVFAWYDWARGRGYVSKGSLYAWRDIESSM